MGRPAQRGKNGGRVLPFSLLHSGLAEDEVNQRQEDLKELS